MNNWLVGSITYTTNQLLEWLTYVTNKLYMATCALSDDEWVDTVSDDN